MGTLFCDEEEWLPYYKPFSLEVFDTRFESIGITIARTMRQRGRKHSRRVRKRDRLWNAMSRTMQALTSMLSMMALIFPSSYRRCYQPCDWFTTATRLVITSILLAHCTYANDETRRICFKDKLGCFTRAQCGALPTERASSVFFHFATLADGKPKLVRSKAYNITSSLADVDVKANEWLRVIVHGFQSNSRADWVDDMATKLLRLGSTKVAFVDWAAGANPGSYSRACANSHVAATAMSIFLRRLAVERGVKTSKMHLIAHSMGAHLSGFVGEWIQTGRDGVVAESAHMAGKANPRFQSEIEAGRSSTELLPTDLPPESTRKLYDPLPSIGRITGLDPANVKYSSQPEGNRLSPNDAVFVDVIHTDAAPSVTDGFGIDFAIGDADFFPNGGSIQPGCLQQSFAHKLFDIFGGVKDNLNCDHRRAPQYFTASINGRLNRAKRSVDESKYDESTSCVFEAYPCASWEEFEKGSCLSCGSLALDGKACPQMGFSADLGDYDVQPNTSTTTTRKPHPAQKMYLYTSDHEPYCTPQSLPAELPAWAAAAIKRHKDLERRNDEKSSENDNKERLAAGISTMGLVIYILLGLTGLIIIAAIFIFVRRRSRKNDAGIYAVSRKGTMRGVDPSLVGISTKKSHLRRSGTSTVQLISNNSSNALELTSTNVSKITDVSAAKNDLIDSGINMNIDASRVSSNSSSDSKSATSSSPGSRRVAFVTEYDDDVAGDLSGANGVDESFGVSMEKACVNSSPKSSSGSPFKRFISTIDVHFGSKSHESKPHSTLPRNGSSRVPLLLRNDTSVAGFGEAANNLV